MRSTTAKSVGDTSKSTRHLYLPESRRWSGSRQEGVGGAGCDPRGSTHPARRCTFLSTLRINKLCKEQTHGRPPIPPTCRLLPSISRGVTHDPGTPFRSAPPVCPRLAVA
ncbi:hypothetical protein E2C01_016232 [Portunus trituberculatus]|uniref:Uncharacterized protein n=1 Tax=Portunus trituberculatus TaxID=210409 RepID=A0A5B7DNJ2_PORTR|nr:hypothetical protein [Portunus trituberculatus]